MIQWIGATILLAWMLFVTAAWAQSPEAPSSAMQLVHAMELPQTIRFAFEGSVRRDVDAGKLEPRVLDCWRSDEMEFAAPAFADSLSRALSKEEIDTAVEFFASREGKEYLRYSNAAEAASRGLPGAEAPGEISDEAYERLQTFLQTSAGRKLLLEHAWRTPELMGVLTKHVLALIERCNK